MLDTRNDSILTAWSAHHAALFGSQTLCLSHRLHTSPLFTDDALATLLETVERRDYHVNLMDDGRRREGELGDLSGAEALRAVRDGEIWINLRAPDRANPAYRALLDEIYDEFETRVDGLRTYRRNMTILISSPKVRVKYHIDVPGQTLWQIRGEKRVFVYPARAPFLPQAALEKVVIGEAHETDMGFQPWFDDYAQAIDLAPGQMLHWPLNAPHRVDNADCLNVSITTEHWTDDLRNAYAVNFANGMMRKAGLDPQARPEGGPGLWTRLGLAGAIKASGLQKREAKPYRIDFAVDPDAPRGARDIAPHDLRK